MVAALTEAAFLSWSLAAVAVAGWAAAGASPEALDPVGVFPPAWAADVTKGLCLAVVGLTVVTLVGRIVLGLFVDVDPIECLGSGHKDNTESN